MHAAAPGETGSEAFVEGELVACKSGAVAPDAGAKLAELTEGDETPCDFASSFFHMGHLDVENWIFEVAPRRLGSELRLRRMKIVQHLAAVNKNSG
jgi:hypothetical protein